MKTSQPPTAPAVDPASVIPLARSADLIAGPAPAIPSHLTRLLFEVHSNPDPDFPATVRFEMPAALFEELKHPGRYDLNSIFATLARALASGSRSVRFRSLYAETGALSARWHPFATRLTVAQDLLASDVKNLLAAALLMDIPPAVLFVARIVNVARIDLDELFPRTARTKRRHSIPSNAVHFPGTVPKGTRHHRQLA